MNSPIEEIQLSDFKQRFIAQDFKILRIKTNFDLKKAQDIYADVLKNYSLKSKDQQEDYLGIGLHYRDEENPLFDGLDQVNYIDQDRKVVPKRKHGLFSQQNEIGAQFQFVEDIFDFLKLGRGRLLVAKPGFKMNPHRDGDFIYTLHFPLYTKKDATFFIEGDEFHLPADGSCYLVNAELFHHVENNSDEDRVHLVYSLSPLNFRHLSSADLTAFQKYFMFIIKNFIVSQAPWLTLD